MRTYELMMIAEPDLDEEGLTAVIERTQQVITTNGGEMVKVEQMGRRKLAYPINKRREGHYVLMHANMERVAISELERSLKLSEAVFRYLLVRLDEVAVVAPAVVEAPAPAAVEAPAPAPTEVEAPAPTEVETPTPETPEES